MEGKDIKKLRKKLKWTLDRMALSLGVDIRTVQRWESNESRPSRLAQRELSRLARKVGK